jgi:hypothetical protein
MRTVDGLSLIFVDFYVPELTQRLNSTETSLQLSELFGLCYIASARTTPTKHSSHIVA